MEGGEDKEENGIHEEAKEEMMVDMVYRNDEDKEN